MDKTLDQNPKDNNVFKEVNVGEIPDFLKKRAAPLNNPMNDSIAEKIESLAKSLAAQSPEAVTSFRENVTRSADGRPVLPVKKQSEVQKDPEVNEDQIKFLRNYAKTVFNKVTKNQELTADDRFKLRVAAEMDRRVKAGEANATKYAYYKVYHQLRKQEAEQENNLLQALETELSLAVDEIGATPVEAKPQNLAVVSAVGIPTVNNKAEPTFEIDEKAFEDAITLTDEDYAEIANKSQSTALTVIPAAVTRAAKETVAEQAAASNDNKSGRRFSFMRALTSLGHGVMAAAVLAAGLGLAAMYNFTPDQIKTAYNDGTNYLSQVFEGDTANTRLATNEDGTTIVRTQTVTIDADGNYVFADTAATPSADDTQAADVSAVNDDVAAEPVVEAAPVQQPSPMDEFRALDTTDQLLIIDMMIADGVRGDLIQESLQVAQEGANGAHAAELARLAQKAGVTLTPAETTVAQNTVETPTVTADETPAVAAEVTEPVTETPVAETVAEETTTAAVQVDFAALSKDEQISQIGSQIAALATADAVSRDVLTQVINTNILVASAGVTDEAHVNALADFQKTMGWTTEEVTTVATVPTVERTTSSTEQTTDFNTAALGDVSRARAYTFEEGANAVRLFYAAHNLEVPAAMEHQLAKMGRTHITGHAEMGAFDAGKILMDQFKSPESAQLAAMLMETASQGKGRGSRFAAERLELGKYRGLTLSTPA